MGVVDELVSLLREVDEGVEVVLVVEADDDSLVEVSSSKPSPLEPPARARRAAPARAARERRILILEGSFREACIGRTPNEGGASLPTSLTLSTMTPHGRRLLQQ